MWFTLEGTTVNSLADMLKYCILDKYSKSLLGLTAEEYYKLNKIGVR